MLTASKIKERFELYRKWFNTFINKEFLNLPYDDQANFLSLIKAFLGSCERLHSEAKNIQEKAVKINVDKIVHLKNSYQVIGNIDDKTSITIDFPKEISEPEIGASFCCIIFSMDGIEWFSSKKELITGRPT